LGGAGRNCGRVDLKLARNQDSAVAEDASESRPTLDHPKNFVWQFSLGLRNKSASSQVYSPTGTEPGELSAVMYRSDANANRRSKTWRRK
jgi:hypothetical protein